MEIGGHICFDKTLLSTAIRAYDLGCSCMQIFMGSPTKFDTRIYQEKDIKEFKEYTRSNGIRVFVHASYLINLAKEWTKDSWHIRRLIHCMNFTRKIGGSGVIVHVGKYTNKDPKHSIVNMRQCIEYVLGNALGSTKLLLETPAGCGTELLTNIDDFISFFRSVKNKRLAICVDTCHVFSSGNSPLDYVTRIINTLPKKVRLIHLNDSYYDLGAKHDKHSNIGEGKIGIGVLVKVVKVANKNGVPIVLETPNFKINSSIELMRIRKNLK